MAADGSGLGFSVASVVEDVLLQQQQQGTRLRDVDLESRKAEEEALRRYDAAGWLKKTVGVVMARDLPTEPSEEEFRLGLRSGIILCNVLNKVQPGAVPKVVEGPYDSAVIPDGAALSAFQYFENVRNFLVAVQDMGVPTFEASDLEQGGKPSRIVNCVLALKSFGEWKKTGGSGVWKFGGNVKPVITSSKSFVRKNSDPFTNSFSRTSSMNDKSLSALAPVSEMNKMQAGSLSMLVRAILLDKKLEDVPALVESVLSKVAEEFENRMINQYEQKISSPELGSKTQLKFTSNDRKTEDNNIKLLSFTKSKSSNEESKALMIKQRTIFDEQQRDIEDLKSALHTTKVGMQFMQMKFHEEFSNLALHIHGLAHAASGYHRVLEENRKLYNQVQDLKGSIRVYCRVRPFLHGKTYMSTVELIEEGTITITTPSKHGKGHRSFNFNKVFGPSATQAEVFSDTQPLIRSVLDGYNVCIFAYGQTGSGKTFTMTGPKQLNEQSQGVNYRALGDLFYLAEQRSDTFRYEVAVQMIEIYNEQVRDLLVTDGTNKRLEIRNSSQKGLSVPDASLVPVASPSDVLELMNLGQKNRAVGATALNDRSSRSHSCLTVHVQGRDLTSGSILRGCMHLVDLAGSERVDKSEVTGDRLKEAQHINKSLSALGDVIASLAQKNPHVPYRNSKLTQLLQDSLGGQAKTLMFVHISPEPDALGETISTLKFAERVATVELGAAKVNRDSSDVKELKEQIASLTAALARKEEEPKLAHHGNSVNSGRRKRNGSELPSFTLNQPQFDAMNGQNSCRQPMGDVGNIEVFPDSVLKQKKPSFDLDELLLGNSPPWPTVPGQTFQEDEKEIGSGEWEDKVMVNKQDGMPLGCWEPGNSNLSDVFYQKYLKDSPKVFPEQTYNMFAGGNGFSNTGSGDVDDLDAATSDSSEHDLLWQFNLTKLNGIANGVGLEASKPIPSKPAKNSDLRSMSLIPGPSPSRKPAYGSGIPQHQNGKRRLNNRK